MLRRLLWLTLVLPVWAGAFAAEPPDTPAAWPMVDAIGDRYVAQNGFFAQEALSLDQAADKVRRAYGGRVLSITPVNRDGQSGFRVRVLVDGGRVKTVYVDDRGRMSGR